MDTNRLRQSWHLVAEYGEQVPLHFYSTLFLSHPETRAMFPTNMAGQRDRLVTALGHIVSQVDQVDALVPFLRTLGADHRKFAVKAEHYPAVGEALVATLRHFLGAAWTEELQRDWTAAYKLVSQVMIEAAEAAGQTSPPWWPAEIVGHERRTFDIAVLTIRPQYVLPFTPGQSIGVSHPAARAWRYYSPANAPRADGTIELHVRAAPGGVVSSRLVYGCRVGDQLNLAAPISDQLVLCTSQGADLLLLAGGTGWAPLKSIVEEVAAEQRPRRLALYIAAQSRLDLYDADAIAKIAAQLPELTVNYVLGEGLPGQGEALHAVDQALADADWRSRHVYICGSDDMVRYSMSRLLDAGYHAGQLHHDGLGAYWYGAAWRTAVPILSPSDTAGGA